MAEQDTADPKTDVKKSTEGGAAAQGNNDQAFRIHKVYVKDVSFESPLAPKVFVGNQNWQPQVNLQINTESMQLENDLVETTLNVQVTVKSEEQTIYLVEVKQAGLFLIKGFDDAPKAHMMGTYCPNILFPFAREEIAALVAKGGFPQLLLEPVNFDALYQQHLQQAKQNAPAPETQQ